MRYIPKFFEQVSEQFIGDNAVNARVLVEPFWQLKKTAPIYGASSRGPFRYYRDVDSPPVQYEVPNVKSISINRTLGEDVASCTITLYNQWHEANTEAPELSSQLGKPGFFWPQRGLGPNPWAQGAAKGAYSRDGVWNPNFSWQNVITKHALLCTYQGYGGLPSDGNYVSVQDNIDNDNVVITGVWIVDSVVGGSDGMLTVSCKDIGRILLDQVVYPPVVPDGLYPLEFYPAGKSAFDSIFGPKVNTGVSPGSKGEVMLKTHSFSGQLDPSVATAFPISFTVDGLDSSYSLSNAYSSPATEDYPWFQYTVNQKVSSLYLLPWGGGYDCYVHVKEFGSWQGSDNIKLYNSGNFNYVKKIFVPPSPPDGSERPINIDLPREYQVENLILSFGRLGYSNVSDSSGYRYRCGIRKVIAYREGAKTNDYNPDFAAIPWTFCMEKHPTRGYWVAEQDGTVHGFGDAYAYDSTTFGAIPLASKHADNKLNAIAAHPDGKGYWALDVMGNIWAYGSASHYGEYVIAWPNFEAGWAKQGVQAFDIAATYTGEGYYVVYTDGTVKAFGDATNTNLLSSGTYVLPATAVTTFMTAHDPLYAIQMRATSVASHPSKYGCWVTNGSGEVFSFGTKHMGQLVNRVYNKGIAGEFTLDAGEFTHAIEATATGDGYWIAFGSGRIAAFGDARGQGTSNIYENLTSAYEDNIVIDDIDIDPSFFRALVWSIARDPDGTGFWILTAAGNVLGYNAEFWGQPSYTGGSGLKWHEGNFNGEASSIVKDVVRWGGFTLFDADLSGTEEPQVYGAIESTGIVLEDAISGDKWDMKTLWDVIHELAEVVGYVTYIDEEGKFRFNSPNMWRAGNFDYDGVPIYVTYDDDGVPTRVNPDAAGAEPFIPVINETVDMFSYSASLNGEDDRSEIIIGSERPDPRDPSRVAFARYKPPVANAYVAPGVPVLRGIERPAIWTSSTFESPEEMELMAEMIGIHSWFASRTGSISCVFNPAISIDDQIRVVDRNTSETFIHRVTSISTECDLDTGVATMNLSTHWLGDADNWVITRDLGADEGVYSVISERLDRWQILTARGLGDSALNRGTLSRLISGTLKFNSAASSVTENVYWQADGTLVLQTRGRGVKLWIDSLTDPINKNVYFKLYQGGSLIKNLLVPASGVLDLGDIGAANTTTEFTFTFTGALVKPGSGGLVARFVSEDFNSLSLKDTLVVVG